MKTQTRNGNGRSKTAPDLMNTLKRGPGRPRKIVAQPTRTADQIAESIEAEIEKLQGIADILRGKA